MASAASPRSPRAAHCCDSGSGSAAEAFFRCNKCYLVNLEHVTGIEENNVLIGNEKVQVSRARKKELLDVLNDYLNEVSK